MGHYYSTTLKASLQKLIWIVMNFHSDQCQKMTEQKAQIESLSVKEKIISNLEEENALLRRQLTDFQGTHM